jgi:hypothetical protein
MGREGERIEAVKLGRDTPRNNIAQLDGSFQKSAFLLCFIVYFLLQTQAPGRVLRLRAIE